ncbi:MAG: allophanate hydrolase [Geminicoccaceae bacterium]
MPDPLSLSVAQLRAACIAGSVTPTAVVEAVLARNAEVGDPAIWITAPDAAALRRRAAELEALPTGARSLLPLFGIPFAVKDNIDVAGMPTTAACPGFAYSPDRNSVVVQRLLDAGAIAVGKTNLDQFATGLVGVRSAYGVPRNAFDARYVPGGSSSGSAIAVARGLAMFALGTDTAGSGRVPAGFNNLVGLKPSRGILSNEGVVPACRSLDCVSIFARSAEDARAAFEAAVGSTAQEPYGRPFAAASLPGWTGLRVGVPTEPEFFGDAGYARLYAGAVERARALGATVVAVDFAPFAEIAASLYAGPWVAERYAAVGDYIAANPDAVHPTTRRIIGGAAGMLASDAFKAMYRHETLRRRCDAILAGIDVLLVPTAPTIPTLADLEADPLGPNTRLGTYTNFVNLLDLAAIAVPAGFRDDGMPFGVTLIAAPMTDLSLLELGAAWQGTIELAVVGAHLEGQPLHHELEGAPRLRRTTTAPTYRLYALSGTRPPKPGIVRVESGGAAIEVETYALTAEAFGRFVARVPPPLAIGSLELAGGSWVKGFVCEPAALAAAEDITAFGGWRAYRKAAAGG